jgi:hypothetical protein
MIFSRKKSKYLKLLKEFYPYVAMEAHQATVLGPSNNDCDPNCPDCQWYNWGLSFKQRIEKGEFNEFNS